MESPPDVVFVAGELPRTLAVAVVGTRTPSDGALQFAHALASDLVKEGIAVLSGGASGIDTAAHLGALAAGGATVVVSPSSIEHPFPVENAALFERIVRQGGAILSAHEKCVQPRRHLFFYRNEMLAALCHALVLVETRYRGGARNAFGAARSLGRPALVVPGAPWTKSAGGCILELKAGARIAASVDDVLEVLGVASRRPERRQRRGASVPLRPSYREEGRTLRLPGLTAGPAAGAEKMDRDCVVEVLRVGPLWPDEICRLVGLPAPRVQGLLLTLTLDGVVVSEPSGRVSLISGRIS
jgi:DNA processing protein